MSNKLIAHIEIKSKTEALVIRQRRLYSQLKEPIFYLEIASDICVFELHTQNDRILRKNHF